MLSIDEAIAKERQLAERNMILLDSDELVQKSYDTYLRAEYHEQLVMWLEELKAIKSDEFSDDLLNMGFTKGYNKAIDDFIETCEKQSTTMYGQRYIDTRDIKNIADRLREQK